MISSVWDIVAVTVGGKKLKNNTDVIDPSCKLNTEKLRNYNVFKSMS